MSSPMGWVGHSVTRVKCNEMRSLELFNAGGTADNRLWLQSIVYSPRDTVFVFRGFLRERKEICNVKHVQRC